MSSSKTTIIIGSRGSDLALWQSRHVKSQLELLYPEIVFDLRIIKTTGDYILDSPLSLIGGKGVFTLELEQALLRKEIDIAVHSLKDLPTDLDPGLTISAIPVRAVALDAFLSIDRATHVFDLKQGARVATGSMRRKAQMLAKRPDYRIIDIRGNVPTRIQKLMGSDWDGMVLAAAGIERLGLSDSINHIIDSEDILPAPGQGALGIETRAEDTKTCMMLEKLDDPITRVCVSAEREILRLLGGGCQLPLGALVVVRDEGFAIAACIASPTGDQLLRSLKFSSQSDITATAKNIAADLLAQGGDAIIESLGSTPNL